MLIIYILFILTVNNLLVIRYVELDLNVDKIIDYYKIISYNID